MTQPALKCHACHKEIPSDSKFCEHCGKRTQLYGKIKRAKVYSWLALALGIISLLSFFGRGANLISYIYQPGLFLTSTDLNYFGYLATLVFGSIAYWKLKVVKKPTDIATAAIVIGALHAFLVVFYSLPKYITTLRY
ncbi:MAG: zinc ribbon domain-containing protein [Holophagaceae bacterium]|nr:zinc ribbon domain-containing protein [Holophagaceae bacterium]